MAPFTPFFTEYLYQNLRVLLPADQREDSVHYIMFPAPRDEFINLEIEESVAHMQSTIELGRAARDRRKMPLKVPRHPHSTHFTSLSLVQFVLR